MGHVVVYIHMFWEGKRQKQGSLFLSLAFPKHMYVHNNMPHALPTPTPNAGYCPSLISSTKHAENLLVRILGRGWAPPEMRGGGGGGGGAINTSCKILAR